MIRKHRSTKETTITVDVNAPETQISTGVPFFDHMLEQVAVHSGCCLSIEATGDTHVDTHHTVEDTGIVLGQALDGLFGDRRSVTRYAHAFVPMDEALVGVSIDLSGRPFAACSLSLDDTIPGFPEEAVREFLWGLARGGRLTVHVWKLAGIGDHHVIEAAFKGLGRVLRQVMRAESTEALPSSKGVL